MFYVEQSRKGLEKKIQAERSREICGKDSRLKKNKYKWLKVRMSVMSGISSKKASKARPQ